MLFVAALAKGALGEHWRRLFRGDPDGARCLLPPYRLAGTSPCPKQPACCS